MLAVNHPWRTGGGALLIHDAFPARGRQLQIADKVNTAAVIGHRVGHLRIGA